MGTFYTVIVYIPDTILPFFFYKFMFDLYLLHMFWMINNWEEQVILNAKNEIFVRFLQRLFIILVKNYFALDIMQVK